MLDFLKRKLSFLKIPESKKIIDLDSVEASSIHKEIILSKKNLKNVYLEFYADIKSRLNFNSQSKVVELGSGGGFMKQVIPNLLTSDIKPLKDLDFVCAAESLPFEENSIDAFIGVNVLHHFSDPQAFFSEAVRCLKGGGNIVFVEPANTCWGRFIYKNFHHEAFDINENWKNSGGPMSSGNGAIPWIIFFRDKEKFSNLFPQLQVIEIKAHTPFSYLLTGGLSYRDLFPSIFYSFLRMVEALLSPIHSKIGMFMTIQIKKIKD